MGRIKPFPVLATTICLILSLTVNAEDPYLFYTWRVTYGTISPLGIPQRGILINNQFPGPKINSTSNNNIVVNVFNHLDEPLLFTWHGIQQRKNSWQDGTLGTMCPILPGTNFTYHFQVKDQIGSYFYFPTTALHRAAGGIGSLVIHSRDLIPVPFDAPADDFSVLLGDWFLKGDKGSKRVLDGGRSLGRPDGIQINGVSGKVGEPGHPLAVMEPGKTYRYRFCNVGMRTSINVRFQGHSMKLVEIEGSHTIQNVYESLDIHVGQCASVLVTADNIAKDYYLVVSTRFMKKPLQAVRIIRYSNGHEAASPALPPAPIDLPSVDIAWSMNQFRTFRWNLTASAARPNPQGSYHYGGINITRTIKFVNSRSQVNGKLRYAINSISHVDTETPLKLAEYYGVHDKVFKYDVNTSSSGDDSIKIAANVVNATFRNYIEIVFENREKAMQAYHLDGYSFFAVAIEAGRWSPEKRRNYNLLDAVSRHTIQVYPGSWAAVMLTMDNAGMWNMRSTMGERAYLGQQLYFSVLSPEHSLRDEYNLPETSILCGVVKGLPTPPPYSM